MHGVPRSVLVVDDDAEFRGLICRVLNAWGHDVVGEAATVGEALRSVEALRPDALLVDIGLPDGDGLELAGRLAGLPWRPRVLVISTDADGADDATVRQLGVAGFVPKSELPGPSAQRLLEDAL
jgi:CheY-like chemotaxis protein